MLVKQHKLSFRFECETLQRCLEYLMITDSKKSRLVCQFDLSCTSSCGFVKLSDSNCHWLFTKLLRLYTCDDIRCKVSEGIVCIGQSRIQEVAELILFHIRSHIFFSLKCWWPLFSHCHLLMTSLFSHYPLRTYVLCSSSPLTELRSSPLKNTHARALLWKN